MRSGSVACVTFAALSVVVAGAGGGSSAAGQCGPDQEKQKLGGALPYDAFGSSVSVSGNVALVGAIADNQGAGSAYVYRYDGTSWVQEQKLVAADGASPDLFGWSASVSGDVAVVGNNPPFPGVAGAAYVFRHDGTSWVQEQKLLDGATGDGFGYAASVSGNVAVIGAPGIPCPPCGSLPGAAYVFRHDGANWVQEQKLEGANPYYLDWFGRSVSVSGNVAAVLAPSEASAYVFRYDGTRWVEEQTLATPDAADVSVSGNVVVIGAPGDVAAYVFRHDGTRWVPEQRLATDDATSADCYGCSVSVSGNVAVVGASGDDQNAGSAHVFGYDGASWVQEQALTAADAAANDFFGFRVSASGTFAVIGAVGDDSFTGAAYVFGAPAPAWSSYGSGWPGTNGVPSLTLGGDPVLCTAATLDLENSLGADTIAVLVFVLTRTEQPTIYDGHLLVVPTLVFLLAVPASGLSLGGDLPCDLILCGDSEYLQALEVDAGASKGVSFTPGLQLVLGS
ncbi:MAG: hypothetical protein U1E76_27445 [Planctomycetota bacterium]